MPYVESEESGRASDCKDKKSSTCEKSKVEGKKPGQQMPYTESELSKHRKACSDEEDPGCTMSKGKRLKSVRVKP